MKVLSYQPVSDFDSYVTRPGTIFCQREPHDSIEQLYARGYLPYSGATGLHDVWYSARSARVVLPNFSLSSENRRIARKFDGLFDTQRLTIEELDKEEFYDLFTRYSTACLSPKALPRARMEIILASGLVSAVVRYSQHAKVVGCFLELEDGSICEFWQSAYEPAYAKQSLGLWLMLDALRDAKARGLTYYYLGTVYGSKALYKTNFTPLEWWDGSNWSRDLALLKKLAREE